MVQKLVASKYIIDGLEFEILTETELRENNFVIMFGGVEQDQDQFSQQEMQRLSQYVADWRAPDGH